MARKLQVGTKLGAYTVVSDKIEYSARGVPRYNVECPVCKNRLFAEKGNAERSKQCEKCRRKEHGMRLKEQQTGKGSDEARFWAKMYGGIKQRCENKYNPNYALYGGRGIKTKFESAASFVEYMSSRYDWQEVKAQKLQIDREDVNGHYEPGNVRMVTAEVNANNRRNNVVIKLSTGEYNSKQVIAELARIAPHVKFSRPAIERRLHKGQDIHDIVNAWDELKPQYKRGR